MKSIQDLLALAQERVDDFKKLRENGLICLDGNFFPSVHYPPITMYPEITEEVLFEGYTNPADELFDIYAHIPFCYKHCAFCHYPVQVGETESEKDRYLEMMAKEMNIYLNCLGLKSINARSILVGGGTPTYLTPLQLERFLKFFVQKINFGHNPQFSYDVDPLTLLEDVGMERLKIMQSYGVNRLTIGVQSLNDTILKKMTRHHLSDASIQAIERTQKMGFQLNIEFIFGYPGQTLEMWIEDIMKAISFGTEEIQLYRLKVIPYGDRSAAISHNPKKTADQAPIVDQILLMKQIAILLLNEHGYHENLTRVFTKKRENYSHYADHQCCKLFDQIGIGLTAFSSLRDRFGLNIQDFKQYYSMIDKGKLPLNRGVVRTKEEQARWALILPLKNREVYKKFYQQQTGESLNGVLRTKIDRLKKFNLLYEDEELIKLTERGRFFADEICHQFHDPGHMPFPRESYASGELNPYNT